MSLPEKEFQDNYRWLLGHKIDVQKIVSELERHNLYMFYIIFLIALFGFSGLIVLGVIANNLNKIIELFN